ncbi:DUF6165 family protein [Novosphingobium panipatense]|uniref:DUF6165 family protein n=1 Tax=Novosphingobium panipatense TaxID=428991 RepID=UPI003615045B
MIHAPSVPVSWGELLDKLSILEIKRSKLPPGSGLANVEREYALLKDAAAPVLENGRVATLLDRLRRVNQMLWEVEDAIRQQEADARFGPRFVALARSVYQTNDTRAAIKRQINLLLDLELVEEKSYAATLAPLSVEPILTARPAGLA